MNVIRRATTLIEGMLDEDDGGLLEKLRAIDEMPKSLNIETPVAPAITVDLPKLTEVPVTPPVPTLSAEEIKQFQIVRKKHIDELMAIECWPVAVPDFLMAQDASVDDQINRANCVLDMMIDLPKLEGLTFLDFGCGDGWIAQEVMKRGVAESMGYDIKLNSNWQNLTGAKYTHIYNELKRNYYDVIMLYDVLDHCEDPLALMGQVKNILKRDGVVYVRCHPWTSKHASHLYKQGMNKAYMHLFLTYEEIHDIIGKDPMFTRIEKAPIEAYHWWFNEFDIKKERAVKDPVSDFFHVPSFKELLANEQKIPMDKIDEFLKNMEIQFLDFKLTPKKV